MKRKQLGIKLKKYYWLIERKSIYLTKQNFNIWRNHKTHLYLSGIELWATTTDSNVAIINRFQPKVIRAIADSTWFITSKYLLKLENTYSETSYHVVKRLHLSYHMLGATQKFLECEKNTQKIVLIHYHPLENTLVPDKFSDLYILEGVLEVFPR